MDYKLVYLSLIIGQFTVACSVTRPLYGSEAGGDLVLTHLGRHIDQHSADMSTNRSVECWSICRPRCRPIYRSRGAQNAHDDLSPYALSVCVQAQILGHV